MTDKQIKVGDVVAWPLVQDGWLVRVVGDVDSVELPAAYAIRHGDGGKWVCDPDDVGRATWTTSQLTWRWGSALNAGVLPPAGECTVIATGLTGQETAGELQKLAEVFEVREAFCGLAPTMALVHALDEARDEGGPWPWDNLAGRLHAAGWRPGMTAEDAARLLAEAG